MNKIVVLDYGMGNLGSILNMLKKMGVPAELSRGPEDVLRARKLILPGVGAFASGMKNLRERGYIDALKQKVVVEKTPILGICLGMQLFSKESEEGGEAGLGWLEARTVRFQFSPAGYDLSVPLGQLKIHHMGWNTIRLCQKSPFFLDAEEERRFYFVHSFHMQCNDPRDILARTQYGIEFTSAVRHENILGTQFHPEKSHRFGLAFFNAFAAWVPATDPDR
jgi:glutamine amidotransferase